MKKGHIRILVVVMSAALLGLLAVQWFWVRNAVAVREKQFQHRAMGALESVAERLQDREISIAISGGRLLGLPFLMPACLEAPKCESNDHDMRQVAPPWRIITDSMPTRITQRRVNSHRLINGQWISGQATETRVTQGDSEVVFRGEVGDPAAKDYVRGFVERMLHEMRPIHERLNMSLLDSLIKLELSRREIEERYVYGIHSEGFASDEEKEKEMQMQSLIDYDGEYFRVQLFPHDIRPSSEHYLELQFPDHTSPAIKAMGLVLPTSGILVLIVMFCFGIALFAFRRQQKLSDLKTDFINNMTHELKTPISTISLALEALGDPDMQTKERISLYAKVIEQENERLKIQVERVLQAAALERGELKLDLQPADIDLVLREQIERIRLYVEGRGGKIDYQPEATDTSVLADEVHLGGVIFNLLDNANKYSPLKPQIDIITRNVADGIEIVVLDQGLGISAEAQRKVFEKFYRVPTGNVHDVKGFGIGLSYSRSMAKAHGGDIGLTSDLGSGSTFTLFIPQK